MHCNITYFDIINYTLYSRTRNIFLLCYSNYNNIMIIDNLNSKLPLNVYILTIMYLKNIQFTTFL